MKNTKKFEDKANLLMQEADLLADSLRLNPMMEGAYQTLEVVTDLIELGKDNLLIAQSVFDRGKEAGAGADLLDLSQQLFSDCEAILDLHARLSESSAELLNISRRLIGEAAEEQEEAYE